MIHLQVHLQMPCYDFLILGSKSITRSQIQRIAPPKIDLAKNFGTPIQATGGVYKKQERFQYKMVTCIYMKFLFHDDAYKHRFKKTI